MENNFKPFDFGGDFSPHIFKKFLKYCASAGASDILIQGGDFAWAQIHGRQKQASLVTIKQGQLDPLIAAIWKAEVTDNIRKGQGADRALELSGEELGFNRGEFLRFRCNFVQARVARQDQAYSITLRTIPSNLPNIKDACLDDDLFQSMYPGMGLVLVCGPTGSGKTTLQAGVYGYAGQAMPDRKVVTYEDPIEFVLGGKHWKGPQPSQSQIGRDIENFALALKNAMRRAPSIIGIGEARDLETIDAMVEAGLTGHLCYATVHTNTVADTINRLIQAYPPEQQSAIASRLIGALQVIIVQRLLKTTDGKRQAIREYIVFDRELKSELQSENYEKWGHLLRQKLHETKSSLEHSAWKLYKTEKISRAEFIELAGYKTYKNFEQGME